MRDPTMNGGTARSVLVTGGSSGIGRCVARGLQARGYRVFATARRAPDLEVLRNEGFEAIPLELTDSASIREAADRVLERSEGRLYGLFNNAGYGQTGAVEDLSREVLRAQFETNLFGPVELTNHIIPAMRRQGRGRIINNSSVLGLVALPFRGAYSASKFALEAITDSLRLELAGSGTNTRFSRHPQAVLNCVVRALESRRPKIRYYVTPATPLLAALRRLLPYRALDRVASWAGS
jgi:NAD(P)-dependent dehydrogenase (short-subunit alcohol dehydrogenase family)